jgi:hypothetical protein
VGKSAKISLGGRKFIRIERRPPPDSLSPLGSPVFYRLDWIWTGEGKDMVAGCVVAIAGDGPNDGRDGIVRA